MLEAGPLNLFYGDSHIIQNVTVSVADGEGVAILGRNGAGKTTLFKGFMNGGPRAEGPIVHRGKDITGLAAFARARRGLGLVPEDRRIYPHLTVSENIQMGRHAVRPGIEPYTLEEIFGFFPMLRELQDRLGFELSGGQQQVLAIARSVFSRPDCLLLDEPTEGVAPVIVQDIARQLSAMRKNNGMTLLLTEQNVWFARACTDRLYLLDSGRIVFSGDWKEFDADPELKTRYLAV
ncbi:amino acid/amide ABC transporter ATP-binding protein 2, HAAT family [Hoeflea sp. IMCC20628]|uniref:ABC transporter ATP-binding protein n=1 Tax=Hoeflea sp. IMCC20628 TaxID=1620421 RepID=UPI00063A95E6|nr:ABC transporter ATP-binding protein [Hoeflea sp. IMCC20628]AKH98875.1 amino acid/amide ABC transporter ATP-binding protein 2, HAAT family [Hoeflea sp. IMCC20628]